MPVKRLVIIAVVGLATACGQGTSASPHYKSLGSSSSGLRLTPVAPPTTAVEPQAINWSNPEHGTPLSSVVAGKHEATFSVAVPAGLGSPAKVFITRYANSTKTGIQMLYPEASGLVDVEESSPPLPARQWISSNNALIASIGKPDVHGTAGWVSIGRGVHGFWTLDQAKTRADIRWLIQGGRVLVYVSGPAMTLHRVVGIARELERSFSGN